MLLDMLLKIQAELLLITVTFWIAFQVFFPKDEFGDMAALQLARVLFKTLGQIIIALVKVTGCSSVYAECLNAHHQVGQVALLRGFW